MPLPHTDHAHSHPSFGENALTDLVVSLTERGLGECLPCVGFVNLLGGLERHRNVPALHRQPELSPVVLHKVQRHLGVAAASVARRVSIWPATQSERESERERTFACVCV